MKIVITGGAGFIGSHLALALSSAHDVHIVDNLSYGYVENLTRAAPITFHLLDVRSSEIRDVLNGADVVIHLAGISSLPICQSQPALAYDINAMSVANILEASRKSDISRFIFSSTTAVYENNRLMPLKEDAEVCPDLIYSNTKYAAERICQSYATNYGMDIAIVRFANVYGPHQNIKRASPPFTSYLIKKVLDNECPILYNKSDSKRDYIYIADVIELLKQMIFFPHKIAGEIFNVSSGRGYSVPEIVAELSEVLGKDISPVYADPELIWNTYSDLFYGKYPMHHERIKAEVFKTSIVDSTKAMKTFNWSPRVTLREGLKRIVTDEISHSSLRG